MRLGAGYDFGAEMGSLVSEDQLETVVRARRRRRRPRARRVLAGGKARPDLGPLFYEPTVLTDVTAGDAECYREETFGPVVSIYPVADVDEAVARANDTEYGLNASVWAATKRAAAEIAARIQAGTVNVNEGYAPDVGQHRRPDGRDEGSGVGRRHGAEGLLKYTEPQTVATTRILNLGGPRGLPPKVWAKIMPPFVKALQYIPGR